MGLIDWSIDRCVSDRTLNSLLRLYLPSSTATSGGRARAQDRRGFASYVGRRDGFPMDEGGVGFGRRSSAKIGHRFNPPDQFLRSSASRVKNRSLAFKTSRPHYFACSRCSLMLAPAGMASISAHSGIF